MIYFHLHPAKVNPPRYALFHVESYNFIEWDQVRTEWHPLWSYEFEDDHTIWIVTITDNKHKVRYDYELTDYGRKVYEPVEHKYYNPSVPDWDVYYENDDIPMQCWIVLSEEYQYFSNGGR
jgi:hypothetical protein